MKVYTFETGKKVVERYDLKSIKKLALSEAIKTNENVLITCQHKPSYKISWFTMYPDGTFIKDADKLSFNG